MTVNHNACVIAARGVLDYFEKNLLVVELGEACELDISLAGTAARINQALCLTCPGWAEDVARAELEAEINPGPT